MIKKKIIIFTLILLTVLLSINLASATDIDNNQTADSITQESIMQETNEIQNDISADTKEITKKTDDTIKEASPTQVDVNNYNELVTQVNKIQQGTQKEYTINLKPGNYNATANMTLKQKTESIITSKSTETTLH
ncbi:MAG: hypothetical protein E7Z75_09865 [Methanobrevibacter olleyae]|uniref:Adhesin-like protein n=1 Tax=Methanobrevibacter olleyae TaxID=294671 RepID=A0A8T3VZI1_METOL|nr:hypothetical protein [Methanobrevibacter olleyae]